MSTTLNTNTNFTAKEYGFDGRSKFGQLMNRLGKSGNYTVEVTKMENTELITFTLVADTSAFNATVNEGYKYLATIVTYENYWYGARQIAATGLARTSEGHITTVTVNQNDNYSIVNKLVQSLEEDYLATMNRRVAEKARQEEAETIAQMKMMEVRANSTLDAQSQGFMEALETATQQVAKYDNGDSMKDRFAKLVGEAAIAELNKLASQIGKVVYCYDGEYKMLQFSDVITGFLVELNRQDWTYGKDFMPLITAKVLDILNDARYEIGYNRR